MRKITPERVRHNAGPLGTFQILLLAMVSALLLAAVGCSNDKSSTADEKPSSQTEIGACKITIDTSAWQAFTAITDAIDAGEIVPRADFDAYGNLPTVTLWRENLKPGLPTAGRVGDWLEGAFWEDLGRTGKPKTSPESGGFWRRFRYCRDRRETIDQRIAELSGPRACDIRDLASFWIEPDRMPESLTINFLPAKAEVRISEHTLMFDTGVLAAGPTDQVIRQMAALLYRRFQFDPGESPLDLVGEEALAQSFRVFMNEGVTGWIEKAVHMDFDSRHPDLRKVKFVPEDFFLKAQEAIGLMNRQLGPILADETVLAEKGYTFARHLAGMNAFSQTGYAMAAVISHQFGDEGLREVRDSVPAFLAAYQEAALLNPVPAPTPGVLGVELHSTVPPLDPEVFQLLHTLLAKNFPE